MPVIGGIGGIYHFCTVVFGKPYKAGILYAAAFRRRDRKDSAFRNIRIHTEFDVVIGIDQPGDLFQCQLFVIVDIAGHNLLHGPCQLVVFERVGEVFHDDGRILL